MNRSLDTVPSGNVGFEEFHDGCKIFGGTRDAISREIYSWHALAFASTHAMVSRRTFGRLAEGRRSCAREAPRAFLDQREISFLDMRKNCFFLSSDSSSWVWAISRLIEIQDFASRHISKQIIGFQRSYDYLSLHYKIELYLLSTGKSRPCSFRHSMIF